MILGHESSGIVDQVGAGVTSLKPGERVCLEPGVPCRICVFCKKGKYNLCPSMVFAATPPYDGTLTGYYKLPSDLCYKLPDHISFEEGALVEPLSVAVHLVRQSLLTVGMTAVVYGAGPVGLLVCAVCRAFGASRVISVDINPTRLEFAKKYAATDIFLAGKAEELKAQLGLIDGADVVIEASGAEASIRSGITVLKAGGVFVQGGMGKSDVNFPITELLVKEGILKGSFRYGPGDYELAVQLLADGRVEVKSLISQKFKFKDAEQAFAATAEGKGIKMLIMGPDNE
jgi:D-xylulose reductase